MLKIGLIKEGKTPPDNRVALTPEQCVAAKKLFPEIEIVVESSPNRCFPDEEYIQQGINLQNDLSDCDVLLGIKEVPINSLIPNKNYFFFSHTKKKQPYNKPLMQALIEKKIKMTDYESLTYSDGARILGFGYFAGVVGAHNGLMTYGKKTKTFTLIPAHECKDMDEMLQQYRYVKLPPMKIAITGSGRVTAGLLDIMSHWDIESVEPEDFLENEYDYPVYTLLKGSNLYEHKQKGTYSRIDFHNNPHDYNCKFRKYLTATDILLNGIYWDANIPRLFEKSDVKNAAFRISVIADVTCDKDGSVPINIGSSSIANPVYGIDKHSLEQAPPFLSGNTSIDVMAVDNLPNELPRDASKHFGEHIIKYILPELLNQESDILTRATICENGKLTDGFNYLSDYAYH